MPSPLKPHRIVRFARRQDHYALPARRTAAMLVGSLFALMFCFEYLYNMAQWQHVYLPRLAGIGWAFGALWLMHGRHARYWGNVFHLSAGVAYPLLVVWTGLELDRVGVGYLSLTQGFIVINLVLLATVSRFRLLCIAALCNWTIAVASLRLFGLTGFAAANIIENLTISMLLSLAVARILLHHARRHHNNLRTLKAARHQAEQAMRELARSHQEMQHMADRDLLTGLFNRRAGIRHISQLLAAAPPQGQLALLEIDLDRFKPVNDQFGHKAGDVVLQITAERLLTTLQHGDVCCRFGGDEFIVALHRPQSAHIDRLIAELDYELSRPIALPAGQVVSVTASIGRCTMTAETHLEALIEQADNAMYLRKRQRSQDASLPFADRRQPANVVSG